MHEYDPDVTARYFNDVYSVVDKQSVADNPDWYLTHRDRILLKHILPRWSAAGPRILDYGCGQGRLLTHLLQQGYDATGMEKHPGMRQVALQTFSANGLSEERVLSGGVEELLALPPASFDIIVAMGVFQYVPDKEYLLTLNGIRNVLRPGGWLVCSFQNAFFDLFTFNKYTVDFFMHGLLRQHLSEAQRIAVEDSLRSLIAHPDLPSYLKTRARDNVFVRLTNPLTIAGELDPIGFTLQEKYFYEFFGLPPLIREKHRALADVIAKKYEVERATAWEGHFMANAFLVQAQRK